MLIYYTSGPEAGRQKPTCLATRATLRSCQKLLRVVEMAAKWPSGPAALKHGRAQRSVARSRQSGISNGKSYWWPPVGPGRQRFQSLRDFENDGVMPEWCNDLHADRPPVGMRLAGNADAGQPGGVHPGAKHALCRGCETGLRVVLGAPWWRSEGGWGDSVILA